MNSWWNCIGCSSKYFTHSSWDDCLRCNHASQSKEKYTNYKVNGLCGSFPDNPSFKLLMQTFCLTWVMVACAIRISFLWWFMHFQLLTRTQLHLQVVVCWQLNKDICTSCTCGIQCWCDFFLFIGTCFFWSCDISITWWCGTQSNQTVSSSFLAVSPAVGDNNLLWFEPKKQGNSVRRECYCVRNAVQCRNVLVRGHSARFTWSRPTFRRPHSCSIGQQQWQEWFHALRVACIGFGCLTSINANSISPSLKN